MRGLLYGLAAVALCSQPVSAQNLGHWSGVIPFPNIPVSAAVLPNGQLLTWSSSLPNDNTPDLGTAASQTYISHYDPMTGAFTPGIQTSMMADMFCSGIAYLTDGRVMVNGGSSSFHTALYDPATDTWTTDAMMNVARGYNGTVTLSTGEALTIGGSWAGQLSVPKNGEVWSSVGGWRTTAISDSNIVGVDLYDPPKGDDHPWLFAASNGRVFHAGPSPQMNWINTTANGTITPAGPRADDPFSINGVAVMYEPGKILKTGGAPSYSGAYATTNSYVIDITAAFANPAAPVVVRPVTPMTYSRAFANGVLLPGGQVLIIGGETHPITFNDDTSVLTPELWDPATEQFTPLAPMDTPRNYHSVALLLPDGRVFSGGGGLCGNCLVNHQNGEIFAPPYLYEADGITPAPRPEFTLVSSDPPGEVLSAPLGAGLSIPLGATLVASTNGPVQSFEMIRLSATTHAINTDQRRVPMGSMSVGENAYLLTMSADPGIVVPGYWMIFALNASGTPSVAKIIKIT